MKLNLLIMRYLKFPLQSLRIQNLTEDVSFLFIQIDTFLKD